MKTILFFLTCTFLSTAFAAGNDLHTNVIYGDDNRRDVFEAQTPAYRIWAESTAALFPKASVKRSITGSYSLKTANYGSVMKLCKGERFYNQPVGAACSASLVGPDLMMTAGHCIRSQATCDSTTFVFNYSVTKNGKYPKSVSAKNVYQCRSLLHRIEESDGVDFALVKLDRPVTGRSPLTLNRTGKIAPGTPVVVIGHPAGLPTKIADGAEVRSVSRDGYFVANLDSFGGNSGSAVFNAKTGNVEGILVRGEVDYVQAGNCFVSNRCGNSKCHGEDVTKISELLELIP